MGLDLTDRLMTFSLFEILIIIGLSQGLVTSVLLLTSRDRQLSKRILGVTVLVFCVAICRTLLHSTGLWNTLSFRYFPVGMELLLPALVYLYVLSLTEADFRLKRIHGLLFIPGLCYAIYDIGIYLAVVGLDSFAAKRAVTDAWYYDQINEVEDLLIVVVTMASVVAGYQKIRAYLNWLQQFKGHREMPIYRWLKSIIKWGVLLGLVLMLNELLDTLSLAMDVQTQRWRFFNLFLAFVTYYLGFMGYRQDGMKVHDSKDQLSAKANRLNAADRSDVWAVLQQKMHDDQVYLDPSLTLKELAEQLGVSAEQLSLLINQKQGMGFRDWLNRCRVEHFKSLVSSQAVSAASILALALDSGFNSQASFYRAFNKFAGTSPKAYIDGLNE